MVTDTLDAIHLVAGMAAVITPDDVRAVLNEFERTDALMPIMDPTGYRAIMGNMTGHRELVEAFFTFRLVIEKLMVEA